MKSLGSLILLTSFFGSFIKDFAKLGHLTLPYLELKWQDGLVSKNQSAKKVIVLNNEVIETFK